MNEKLNLVEILKDCPKGTKFYSSIYGEVEVAVFWNDANYPIRVFCPTVTQGIITPLCKLSKDGKYNNQFDGECTLFPSKGQRDWSKFTAPWLKKERFDPKTLQAFDKVIVKPNNGDWHCSILSHREDNDIYYRMINGYGYSRVIPYNDDTKHLLGTVGKAPEYYRYWED